MRIRVTVLLIVAVSIFTGCGSSQKVTQTQPTPGWVQSRPSSQLYYVGIGSARKTSDPNGYMQAAKQNALADLSSEISINISSNSVLSAFETQQRYIEDYSSTVRADAQKELEGYELVETWEDNANYWAYYRLSKETYRKLAEEKKEKASLNSLDFYDKALGSIANGDVRVGVALLIKAMESIKPYFAETITATYNGENIFLGNEIIQTLAETLNGFSIVGSNQQSVKFGESLSQDKFKYGVMSKDGTPQKGIPVKAIYSENPLQVSRSATNSEGYASFSMGTVQSQKSLEKVSAQVDIDALVAGSTRDFTIRKLLSRFSTPVFTTIINVTKPVFYVTINAPQRDTSGPKQRFLDVFKQKLTEAGMQLTDDPKVADFKVEIDASLKFGPRQGGYSHASVWVTVVAKNSSNVEVYRKSLDNIKGTHFGDEAAGKSAVDEAAQRLQNSVINEMLETLVRGKGSY